MKAVFLDIDGVANSTASVLGRTGTYWDCNSLSPMEDANVTGELLDMIGGEFGWMEVQAFQTICPTSVSLINRLCARANAVVVLSSSHRSLFANFETGIEFGSADHLKALDLYLKLLGLEVTLYGVTPKLYTRRGLEVAEYLEKHPEIEEHVALDDSADFHPGDCLHFKTDPHYGFSGHDYIACSKLLGCEEGPIIL
jgi:hypothetical protein